MQNNIHPTWYNDAVVTCSCGNTFTTGSTQKKIEVDICSACHPFFTGEMKFVDRQGRVDKFKKKMKVAHKKQQDAQKKQQAQQDDQTTDDPKTYQQILREKQAELRKQAKQE